MIFLLEKYRDFITRDITFGKSRLFDEIINYDDYQMQSLRVNSVRTRQ